jgi:dTDP-4-amino-4,6-dideoxygalactose transaminase
MITIPQANPGAAYRAQQIEIDTAVAHVLASGWYVLGSEVQAFETEFARWNNLAAVVGVANGTDAIELMLRALEIGPGDEVITTPHTATATISAIELAQAVPVLVDINSDTYTVNVQQVAAAVQSRTRALLPVHLFGLPADITALSEIAKQHDVFLLEDCAQAHGARFQGQRVGTFGPLASFSFYPTKNLGALGDAGAVGISDIEFVERVRSLAQYGWRQRYISSEPGKNSRLDEIQAAVLRVKLQTLDANNARRAAIATRYSEALQNTVQVPIVPAGRESVFHLYVIRHPERDRLRTHLADHGIGTAIHYPVPLHMQPAYRGRLGDAGSFPESERAAAEILSLPLYPELSDDDVNKVIEAVLSFV